jgi:hypothetical protein
MKTYLRIFFAIASIAINLMQLRHRLRRREPGGTASATTRPVSRTALQDLRLISKTAIFGEINCLDSGGFGAVTITVDHDQAEE